MIDLPPASPEALLSLLQLSDSFFPTGAYSHSSGLETAVAERLVRTTEDVVGFLDAQLRWQIGVTDLVALCAAAALLRQPGSPDWAQLTAIDRRLAAVKPAREAREASLSTGRRLATEVAAFSGAPLAIALRDRIRGGDQPGNHAVALGVAGVALHIPEAWLAEGYLYSFSVNLLSAAVRLLPFAHDQAQHTLHAAKPLMSALAADAQRLDWRQMAGFAPLLEWPAIQHERARQRLFRS